MNIHFAEESDKYTENDRITPWNMGSGELRKLLFVLIHIKISGQDEIQNVIQQFYESHSRKNSSKSFTKFSMPKR